MQKFRRKTQIVEAEQYHYGDSAVVGMCLCNDYYPFGAHVHTIHNNQGVSLEDGDWILPEPDGKHFYPVKKEIFESAYEPIFSDDALLLRCPFCDESNFDKTGLKRHLIAHCQKYFEVK